MATLGSASAKGGAFGDLAFSMYRRVDAVFDADRAGDQGREHWKGRKRVTILQPPEQEPPYHDLSD